MIWDYKDLKGVKTDELSQYFEAIKKNFFSEDMYNDFTKLQRIFEEIRLDEPEDFEDSVPKTKVEVSQDLLSERMKTLQPKSLSKFFTEEIEFFSQFWKENKNSTEDSELAEDPELVDLPLPADNYFIYKKLKSAPDDKIKHEFMFLVNIFSAYLQEPAEDILKVNFPLVDYS